jgi:anti-anti-sigma factor
MLAELVFETSDGIAVARVTGEVDMSNAADLMVSLREAVDQDTPGLVLDLTGTTYLDSSGLHNMFDLAKRLRDRGQRLHIVVPAGSALEPVISLAQVDALAPIERTVEDALAQLSTFRNANDPGEAPGSFGTSD